MAGLTSTFTYKPTLSRPTPPLPPLSLSSLHSNLFGLRLHNPNFITPKPLVISASSTLHSAVSARYDGGRRRHRWKSGGGNRRSRDSNQSNIDDDQALNISTIGSDTVRLIDQQQNMVGVMSMREALDMAEDAKLDLVIVSPDADPPVVKIMDYKKYKYELEKKKREQKKNPANRMDMKTLTMRYNIDVHDYSVRVKAAKNFLKDGDKVKVTVRLTGRENEFRNNANELIKRFQNDVGELATEESKGSKNQYMFIVLAPNKAVVQKSQEPPRPKNNEKSAAAEVAARV